MKQTAFTLIELLVVIATIALLMAILVPSLQNSRRQAKTVLCGSNVKQLALGLFTYETEHQTFPYGFRHSFSPPSSGYPGNLLYDRMGWWWFNSISDYSRKNRGKKAGLWCPSRQINNVELTDYVLHGNYGVNQSICKSSDDILPQREEFVGTPLRSIDIPHPGQTLLIVDSSYSIISWWHVTDVPPVSLGSTVEDTAIVPGLEINKDKNIWPGEEQDAINGRHPNKIVNVGFADGHVDRTKAKELLVEKTADVYKNRIPLWSPK